MVRCPDVDIVLNGKHTRIDDGTTVADLIEQAGLGPRRVVVERNGEPLERDAFATTTLAPGDRVEIVRAVAGGASIPGALPMKDKLAAARLYLVAPGEFPVDVLGMCIDAGVDIVQLRMKDAEAAEVIEIGDAWLHVCRDAGIPFIVNDRADVALALGADGVHLGQGDLPPNVARDILGPDAIIGRSTHSVQDITHACAEAADGCADYIAVGPVHETPTKAGRPGVGYGLVRDAAGRVTVPWFAIGGLNASNVGDVRGAGAERIVVVRAITEADDPPAAAAALKEALTR